ncbi:tRNA (uracil-5-)-methyltransferase, partial [Salmonella enterica subsp. enterica serovar Mbandaka]
NPLRKAVFAGVRHNPALRHRLFQTASSTSLNSQGILSCFYQKWPGKARRGATPALRDVLHEKRLNVHLIGRATKTKIEMDQDY